MTFTDLLIQKISTASVRALYSLDEAEKAAHNVKESHDATTEEKREAAEILKEIAEMKKTAFIQNLYFKKS